MKTLKLQKEIFEVELFNLYLHPDYPNSPVIIDWDKGCRRDGPVVSGGIQLEIKI